MKFLYVMQVTINASLATKVLNALFADNGKGLPIKKQPKVYLFNEKAKIDTFR